MFCIVLGSAAGNPLVLSNSLCYLMSARVEGKGVAEGRKAGKKSGGKSANFRAAQGHLQGLTTLAARSFEASQCSILHAWGSWIPSNGLQYSETFRSLVVLGRTGCES